MKQQEERADSLQAVIFTTPSDFLKIDCSSGNIYTWIVNLLTQQYSNTVHSVRHEKLIQKQIIF